MADEVSELRERVRGANARMKAGLGREQRRERMEALRRLAILDPRAAREVALGAEETPGGEYMERYSQYRGAVEVTVEDRAGYSVYEYRYQEAESGEWVTARMDGREAVSAGSGAKMALRTLRFGDRAVVVSAELLERALVADPACPTVGEQGVAVILVNLPGQEPLPFTAAEARELVFGENGATLQRFLGENSDGKMRLKGEVFGPYTLTGSIACDLSPVGLPAMAAAQREASLAGFNRIIVIGGNDVNACGFSGKSTIGCVLFPAAQGGMKASLQYVVVGRGQRDYSEGGLFRTDLLNVMHHEFGHGLGLQHGKLLVYNGEALGLGRAEAVIHEYGDAYNTMGRAENRMGFGVNQKQMLGWLEGGQITTVTASGTYTVGALSATGGGTKALRIRRRVDSREQSLVLHYERAGEALTGRPWGGGRPVPMTDVAVVRQMEGSEETESFLLDMTPPPVAERADLNRVFTGDQGMAPGTRWVDPYSPLSITVLDRTETTLTVRVAYEPECATYSLSPGANVGANGGRLTLSVAAPAGCPWELTARPFWMTPRVQKGIGPATVVVEVEANGQPGGRSGAVTLGRNTRIIEQSGRAVAPVVAFGSPNAGPVRTGVSTSFSFLVRDENGVGDVRFVDVVIGETADQARGCAFRIDATVGTFTYLVGSGRDNAFCTLGGYVNPNNNTFRGEERELRPEVVLKPALGAAVTVFVEAEDRSGLRSAVWRSGLLRLQTECRVSVFPGLHFSAVAGDTTLPARAEGCALTATSEVSWVRATVAGPESIRWQMEAYSGAEMRSGYVNVSGNRVLLTQSGLDPVLRPVLRPQEWEVGNAGGEVQFQVGLAGGFLAGGRVTSTVPWLTGRAVDNKGGVYPFVEVTVAPNLKGEAREGDVLVAGSAFRVRQGGTVERPSFAASSVANLNGDVGWVSAGGFVVVSGSNLAGTSRAWSGADMVDGRLPEVLAGVSARCDGMPLYPAFVSPGQVNLYFDVAGEGTCELKLTRDGVESVGVRVGYGSGYGAVLGIPHAAGLQAAAVFGDGTLAGSYGRPVRGGELISVFAMGLGETEPMPEAGRVLKGPLALRRLPVVTVGGLAAVVEWGGLVGTGVYQVNLRVPEGLAEGNHEIRVGDGPAGRRVGLEVQSGRVPEQ